MRTTKFTPPPNILTEILVACGALDVNQEGYVVQFSDGQRFKFKSDRCLELQKLLNGLSRKAVFRAVAVGEIDSLLRRIPEVHPTKAAFSRGPRTANHRFAK